jgi:hypothetical protein
MNQQHDAPCTVSCTTGHIGMILHGRENCRMNELSFAKACAQMVRTADRMAQNGSALDFSASNAAAASASSLKLAVISL